LILKNFLNLLFRTNNTKFYSNSINYFELFNIFQAFRNNNKIYNIYFINEHNMKFNDYEFIIYINVILYINKYYKNFKSNYKNIYNLIFIKQLFIKNIIIYKNIFNYIKNFLLNLLNLIIFNIKWVLVALVISIIYFFISLFYIQIDIAKQIALWYIFGIIYYLLMSTFNSFLIKYKYGKFTSAIQRFWKRTGMVFWLIEGFLFLLFFYYFLNSSQEPLYMFDYSSLNVELLIQLKTTFKNLLLLTWAIYFSFVLIYNLNFLNYFQNLFTLTIILLIIFYSLYIESYQFVYIISLYSDKTWLFEDISQSWILEVEQNNLRVKQQYFIYCLIAKYWHFIFIFISWFFFFIKSLEIKKISYTMLGYNTQNLLILYVLNILCLIQWIKYSSKKFLEIIYYWFHFQYDEKLLNTFFFEIYNVLFSTINNNFTEYFINGIYSLSNIIFYPDNLDLWKYL